MTRLWQLQGSATGNCAKSADDIGPSWSLQVPENYDQHNYVDTALQAMQNGITAFSEVDEEAVDSLAASPVEVSRTIKAPADDFVNYYTCQWGP